MSRDDWGYQYQLYRNIAIRAQLAGIAAKMQDMGYGQGAEADHGFAALAFRDKSSRKSPLADL